MTDPNRKKIVRAYVEGMAKLNPIYAMTPAEFEAWYHKPDPTHQIGIRCYYESALEALSVEEV